MKKIEYSLTALYLILNTFNQVSLLTISGCVLVPFRVGAYQQSRLDAIKGQADLIHRKGTFSLAVTLDVPEPTPNAPEGGTLGVDLGIVNLATDSEGETFSGPRVAQRAAPFSELVEDHVWWGRPSMTSEPRVLRL